MKAVLDRYITMKDRVVGLAPGLRFAGAPSFLDWVNTGAPVTWVDMPAAVTIFNGDIYYYRHIDGSSISEFKIYADLSVGAASGAVLLCQYQDGGSAWNTIASVALPTVSSSAQSAWTAWPADANTADATIRLAGQSGNGIADPVFRAVLFMFR